MPGTVTPIASRESYASGDPSSPVTIEAELERGAVAEQPASKQHERSMPQLEEAIDDATSALEDLVQRRVRLLRQCRPVPSDAQAGGLELADDLAAVDARSRGSHPK